MEVDRVQIMRRGAVTLMRQVDWNRDSAADRVRARVGEALQRFADQEAFGIRPAHGDTREGRAGARLTSRNRLHTILSNLGGTGARGTGVKTVKYGSDRAEIILLRIFVGELFREMPAKKRTRILLNMAHALGPPGASPIQFKPADSVALDEARALFAARLPELLPPAEAPREKTKRRRA